MPESIDIPGIYLLFDVFGIALTFGDNTVDCGDCVEEDFNGLYNILANADLGRLSSARFLADSYTPGL
ncbi:hypothetical protein HG530_012796 [Fusarium avenaceum]|nr:hypothetical protein HG530_012796 [Fusarium avenaceum]